MSDGTATGTATIEVRRNGPYRVRGSLRLCDADGRDAPAPASFALCRCGNSSKKPFCDGTHWYIKFHDDKN